MPGKIPQSDMARLLAECEKYINTEEGEEAIRRLIADNLVDISNVKIGAPVSADPFSRALRNVINALIEKNKGGG